MTKYADAQEVINSMAQVKMTMNSHKGNIEDIAPASLINLIRGEVEELKDAIAEDDLMHVIEEAADVQNFLLAVVHQQIEKYRGRK